MTEDKQVSGKQHQIDDLIERDTGWRISAAHDFQNMTVL
jgi:hypothetical protein